MQHAMLRFCFPDDATARAIHGALVPETAAPDVPKTRARVEHQGRDVLVTVEADDLPSLRAALNSYCRWVDAAERAAAAAHRAKPA